MSSTTPLDSSLPSRFVLVAGTYDGVLAGWEIDDNNKKLKLSFATPVHDASIRDVGMANDDNPGMLVTCGHDEMLKTHDWTKRTTSSGQVRTPSDFGTPTCLAHCPPTSATHVLVGFHHGQLVLYKKRDWSIQHVFVGHKDGISSMAVHSSGTMCLTGGTRDGKIKLWDLTRARLAFSVQTKTKNPIESLIWSHDDSAYGYCSGNTVVVQHVASGQELLHVELPSRVNQIAFVQNDLNNLFVAAACNDGSLPVLLCNDVNEPNDTSVRALMAIEPVDKVVAGEERFKCIQSLDGYLVATANSAGVISIMDLRGATKMILDIDEEEDDSEDENNDEQDDKEDQEDELAVDILESVRLGTGARITSLAVWSHNQQNLEEIEQVPDVVQRSEEETETVEGTTRENQGTKRKHVEVMDQDAVERARALVQQAKKVKHQKEKKKKKKSKKTRKNKE